MWNLFQRAIVDKKFYSICFISCFSHVTNFIKVVSSYSSRSLIKPVLTIRLSDSFCTNDISLLLINRQKVHKCLHCLIRAKFLSANIVFTFEDTVPAHSFRVYKVTFSTDSYLSTLLSWAICLAILESLGFRVLWALAEIVVPHLGKHFLKSSSEHSGFSKLCFYNFQTLVKNSIFIVFTTTFPFTFPRSTCRHQIITTCGL